MHRASMCKSFVVCLFVAASQSSAYAKAPSQSPFSKRPTLAELSRVLIFEEPLLYSRKPSSKEIQLLAQALGSYIAQGQLEGLSTVQDYLKKHPSSPWRLSLLVNVGLMHRHVGNISEAIKAWEAAWAFGKTSQERNALALAHRALGELLEVNAGLGRQQMLESLIKEADTQELSGLITEKLSIARESLSYMKTSPDTAFRCGPVALSYVKATESPSALGDISIHQGMLSNENGTNLAMNQAWSSQMGLKLQMAKRNLGAGIPVPSVLHFRTGHFAAALFQKGNRILVQDPFLGDTWIPMSVLDHEVSGYALIAAGKLPKGWVSVSSEDGARVWGKGAWGPGRPDDTRPDSYLIPTSFLSETGSSTKIGFHANLVSLSLQVPAVAYTPTKGPKVEISATYNQREYGQPQVFDYCNLGPKWTFSYLTCLKDDSTNPDFNVTLCNPSGGGLIFQSRGDGTFLPEGYTQAQLVRQPGNTYYIQYIDGQKDFYEAADRVWGLRRVVLTRRQDAAGNEIKFIWDAMLRLVSVVDATGQKTLLKYESSVDPLKLTSVTDPFGHTTRFHYDESGRLVKTVDIVGAATVYSYGPTNVDPRLPLDFLRTMVGPAGTINYRAGETLIGPSYRRWLEVRNSDEKVERVEAGAGYAYEIDPEQIPNVPEFDPAYHPLNISFRETFYWSAGNYDSGQPDFRKARHIRWGHGPGGFSSGIVLSEKIPGKPRHWFVHAGDFWGGIFPLARNAAYPMTSEGALKPGRTLNGISEAETGVERLVPVFDGSRRLVTRDYWQNPDGSLGWNQYQYDTQGRLIKDPTVSQ